MDPTDGLARTNTSAQKNLMNKEQTPPMSPRYALPGPRASRLRAVRMLPALVVSVLLLGVCGAAPAAAAPVWKVKQQWAPTNVAPGGDARFRYYIYNYGPDGSTGDVTAVIQLPDGVTRVGEPFDFLFPESVGDGVGWACAGTNPVTCTTSRDVPPRGVNSNSELNNGRGVGVAEALHFHVAVDPNVSGTQPATVTVSGGGAAAPATDTSQITFSNTKAPFGVVAGTFEADAYESDQPDAPAVHQAGAHPSELRVEFDLTTRMKKYPSIAPGQVSDFTWVSAAENVKTIDQALPAGLIGNPQAYPKCSQKDFQEVGQQELVTAECAPETQVGVADIRTAEETQPEAQYFTRIPIYNLEPDPGKPADIAFNVADIKVHLIPDPDPARGYALRIVAADTAANAEVQAVSIVLWGVPADPAHFFNRAVPKFRGLTPTPWGIDSAAPRRPFLTLPMECGVGRNFTTTADSWVHAGQFTPPVASQTITYSGCNDPRIRFKPQAAVTPSSRAAGAPTGVAVDIKIPETPDTVSNAAELYAENGDPSALPTPPVKSVEMTMPEGMTLSASSADGLQACSPAQIGLGTDQPPACPPASQIGTVEAVTPILPKALQGKVFVAKQNDNPFGTLISLYLVLESKERGILMKIPGRADLDQSTGRITTSFSDLPQYPLSSVSLKLKGGPRAPLANPAACGDYEVRYKLTAWSGHEQEGTYPYKVDQNCTVGFAPNFRAGSGDPSAGKATTFAVQATRTDTDEEIAGLDVSVPAGLLATIKGIPLCSDAQAATGSCGADSQIGRVEVGSGAGSSPLYLPGTVHLTEGYKGAPFGLAISVPAAAGPFDLGLVNVRAAVHVDPETAALSVDADPLPRIIQGVPVKARDIRVIIDRPGFMQNPTSCAPMTIGATLTSFAGSTASRESRFQAGDCSALKLTPKLALALSGKTETKDGTHPALKAKAKVKASSSRVTAKSLGLTDGGHPDLTAHLTMAPGGANLSSAEVTLPLSLALEPENANKLCEPSAAAENKCPKASIVGQVKAVSPILDGTLDGPVYFVRGERKDPKTGRIIKTLPTLFIPLTSSTSPLLVIYLKATSQVRDNHLVTTFKDIPDAPVSDFVLKINGGSHGILVVSGKSGLCGSVQKPVFSAVGHNGKRHDGVVPTSVNCPLNILASSHTTSALRVKIGGLGAGKVIATASGATKATKTIASAGIATLSLPLKRSVRVGLSHGRNAKVTVSVAFTAKGAKKAKRVKKTLIIHATKN